MVIQPNWNQPEHCWKCSAAGRMKTCTLLQKKMHNTYFLKEYYTIKSKEHLYMQNKTFLKTPRSAPAWIQLWYWLDVEFLFYHICYSINKKRSRRSKGAYPLPLCHSKSHRCVSQLQHITLSPSQKVPLHIPVNGTTQSYFPKWLWSPSKANPGHLLWAHWWTQLSHILCWAAPCPHKQGFLTDLQVQAAPILCCGSAAPSPLWETTAVSLNGLVWLNQCKIEAIINESSTFPTVPVITD